mmetsp:Transcript_62861/g.97871  ORF Transcript_62861/g.97871 Transcript_62861/m.97871 type:complete len:184 (+) Transcript_62861:1-552(+)
MNGSLDPKELFPMLLDMTSADQCALDMSQCVKFAAIFDDDHNGVISKAELVNFARFLMIASYLETEEGQKVRQEAIKSYKQEKATRGLSTSIEANRGSEVEPHTLAAVRSSANLPTASNELGHLTVDVEHYREKSKKLQCENDALRERLHNVEQQLRQMQSRVEEQDRQLRHADMDLKAVQRR